MMALTDNPGKANQFMLFSVKESYSTKREQKSRLTLVPLKGNTLNSLSAFPRAIYTFNGDNPYFNVAVKSVQQYIALDTEVTSELYHLLLFFQRER